VLVKPSDLRLPDAAPIQHNAAHRSGRPPSWALKIQRGPRENIFRNNFTPNCVTITQPASDRKEQKFSVPRSARIARQDSRFGCRQIPPQAFHDQSVDLLKKLLRDSDVFFALRIDGLRNMMTLDSRVAIARLFRRFAVDPRNIAHVAFPKLACLPSPLGAHRPSHPSLV
jgi:hypothetical protein